MEFRISFAILFAIMCLMGCTFGASVSVDNDNDNEGKDDIIKEVEKDENIAEGSSLKSTLSEVILKPNTNKDKLDTSDSFGIGYVLAGHGGHGHGGPFPGPFGKYGHAYGHGYGYGHPGAPVHHAPAPIEEMIHGRQLALKYPGGPLHHPLPVYTVVDYVPGFHYNFRNHGFNGAYGHGHGHNFGHFMSVFH